MSIQRREILICESHWTLSPTYSRIFPHPRPACFGTRRSCAFPAERCRRKHRHSNAVIFINALAWLQRHQPGLLTGLDRNEN